MAKYLVNGVFNFALLVSIAAVMADRKPDAVLESAGVSSLYFRWASSPASAMSCCQIVYLVRDHILHRGIRATSWWVRMICTIRHVRHLRCKCTLEIFTKEDCIRAYCCSGP